MPCSPFPTGFFPAPPSLPGGVSLPTFTPPSVSTGFCCAIQVPPWGSFPFPDPPVLPLGAIAGLGTMLAGIEAAIDAVFDAVAIPCPTE